MAEGRFIADTLDAVIVGLADSLSEAQEQLSATPPLDSFGRPSAQYRIPYLDFEIGFRMLTQASTQGGRTLLFLKATSGAGSSNEVTSRISGRFVAIPPGEGMPLPVLTATTSGKGAERRLSIQAANSSGEALAGAIVELNVDLTASEALSAAAGVADARIAGNVGFTSAVLTTDQTGRASTDVTFAPGLDGRAVVLITAELGRAVARITTGKAL